MTKWVKLRNSSDMVTAWIGVLVRAQLSSILADLWFDNGSNKTFVWDLSPPIIFGSHYNYLLCSCIVDCLKNKLVLKIYAVSLKMIVKINKNVKKVICILQGNYIIINNLYACLLIIT